ncbi:MAG: UDP-N-acetylmuramate--L-alanine ligase [Treponema sp.]|nr:UDP-N-acetylmuramate--L-alanine ligase [Treponema sp.]
MATVSLPQDVRGVHIHFVGIKGTGMAALVEILHARGAVITGSDVSERFYTDAILEKLSLQAKPFNAENITDTIQFVIYSSAYSPESNPDLKAAKEKQIPCLLYSEALGCISQLSYSCGVCGVHGKTTTTGFVGTLLKQCNLPAQVLAGSVISSFGDSCTMTAPSCTTDGHSYFVAETCEYQRHFMAFCPQKIILTSVESDHQDYYPTYESIRDAFVDYICRLPLGGQVIYCADDAGAVETVGLAHARRADIELIPYGENAAGDYQLEFASVGDGKQHFVVKGIGPFAIRVPGKHMVRNACAAIALTCELLKLHGEKITPQVRNEMIAQGLLQFTGGKRRSELIGTGHMGTNSVVVIDDYGHHPTAIKTTLAGYKDFYKGRKLIVDFMSHTYSRTQALLDEFASSFDSADEIILHKIYSSAREKASDFTITGKTLFEQAQKHYGDKVHYFEEVMDAHDFLRNELTSCAGKDFKDGYLFVTMGAGDNWKLGRAIMDDMVLQEK